LGASNVRSGSTNEKSQFEIKPSYAAKSVVSDKPEVSFRLEFHPDNQMEFSTNPKLMAV